MLIVASSVSAPLQTRILRLEMESASKLPQRIKWGSLLQQCGRSGEGKLHTLSMDPPSMHSTMVNWLSRRKNGVESRPMKKKSITKASFPISIGIGAGNGETIDLADPNQRNNLDGVQKAQAMQQLMAIQEQMNKLMADF